MLLSFSPGGRALSQVRTRSETEDDHVNLSPASHGTGDDVSCTWAPGAVCEDMGTFCAENECIWYSTTFSCCLSITIVAIVLIACSVETIDSTQMVRCTVHQHDG